MGSMTREADASQMEERRQESKKGLRGTESTMALLRSFPYMYAVVLLLSHAYTVCPLDSAAWFTDHSPWKRQYEHTDQIGLIS